MVVVPNITPEETRMAKKSGRGERATSENATLAVRRDGAGKVWSHIRKKWLLETPEERVRQEYLPVLVTEYGFSLEQLDEELEITGRGSGHARADFIIWRSVGDRRDGKNPLIVVECKSDNVTIRAADYYQGDNYARLCGAPFLVTHNTRETKFWRVIHDRAPKTIEEIDNIPHADASDKDIQELIAKLKVFKEDDSRISSTSATTSSATVRRRIRPQHSTRSRRSSSLKCG